MLKIIVDSTCDLSQEYIKKHNIDVISLQVFIDDKGFRDITEINVDYLYEAIHADKDVKTSLPVLTDMTDLFGHYAKSNQPFVFFTFSRAMSGTYNAASIILNELKEEYDTPMAVIDSKNGGIATALIVKRFIEEMNNYETFEEKVNLGNELADNMCHIFLVNDLTQLRRGGRIGRLKSLVGSILNIKPVLYINDGAIDVLKMAIGQKRALNEMLNYVKKNTYDQNQTIGINFVETRQVYDAAKNMLIKNGFNNLDEQRLASVMTAHIGLDAVSIGFFLK